MTINPKIYKINLHHRSFNKLSTAGDIIAKIINSHLKDKGLKQNFKKENLTTHEKDDFIYHLYSYKSRDFDSEWRNFLPQSLTNTTDFTQQKISLIVFIETEFELFCIIGGNSYQIVLPFIDQSFGLNIYARIMKPEKDDLTSMKSRGMTGAIAGQNLQYRGVYRLIDYIRFGKVPQEINVTLSSEITDLHFNFLKSKNSDRLQIYVGKGFKIKKQVSFEELHQIIQELVIISQLVPSDYLSSYEEIMDHDFIENFCKPELLNRIYNDIGNINGKNLSPHNKFQHEFTNPNDMEKFYDADEYVLKEKVGDSQYLPFKTVNDRTKIYDAVLTRALEKYGDNDPFNFKAFILGVRVLCYQDNVKKSTISSGFIFHISTEFPVNGKPVFLIDTKWYLLRDSFLMDLKINAQHILKTYRAPQNILSINWDKNLIKTEKEYNSKYEHLPNYIVVDTVIVDALELCDILYYDNDNLYLVHVKYGFSSNIRELINQITISARRLKNIMGSDDKSTLEKLYSKLVAKGINLKSLSLADFLDLFEKRIQYVLAFTSHLTSDFKVEENIDKFESNIAKYSIIQCSSEMRQNYYDLLTFQIPRT